MHCDDEAGLECRVLAVCGPGLSGPRQNDYRYRTYCQEPLASSICGETG